MAAMFYLQDINLVESVSRGLTGALTIRSPTKRPRDIPTHMIHPLNIPSTVTIYYCDTSTLEHFTVTDRISDILLLQHLVPYLVGPVN
jgi:hypothetical protein